MKLLNLDSLNNEYDKKKRDLEIQIDELEYAKLSKNLEYMKKNNNIGNEINNNISRKYIKKIPTNNRRTRIKSKSNTNKRNELDINYTFCYKKLVDDNIINLDDDGKISRSRSRRIRSKNTRI